MKRIALFLAVFALLLSLASCGKKNKNGSNIDSVTVDVVDPNAKPVYTFTKDDTTEVLNLVRQFISNMEKKDIRAAVEMLNYLESGDSIVPLTPTVQRQQTIALKTISGVKYEIKRMSLRSYTNNEVKVDITLFEKPEGDKRPNMTSFFFRPVKFEGKWYLTVWDKMSNSNQDRNTD